jgi:hypothetical protein
MRHYRRNGAAGYCVALRVSGASRPGIHQGVLRVRFSDPYANVIRDTT